MRTGGHDRERGQLSADFARRGRAAAWDGVAHRDAEVAADGTAPLLSDPFASTDVGHYGLRRPANRLGNRNLVTA